MQDTIDKILAIGVPYMNESFAKYPKEQHLMLKGFYETKGFKDAKQAIKAYTDKARIDELEQIWLSSGKHQCINCTHKQIMTCNNSDKKGDMYINDRITQLKGDK